MPAVALRSQIDETHGLQSNAPPAELTGKMVYMFLTGMVKDKISYTIREICKNAWEVGDFEVFLPTERSPVFRVRDYGPGLTLEFMMNDYMRLGYSTKDSEGVDAMSGFGAGSKSPLAYLMEDGMSGAYSVTSYQDGIARFYSVNLNETGKPQVTLMGEVETEERDGLEVSVPVRRGDFNAFASKTRYILWAFEPRPRVVPDVGWGEPTVVSHGDGWTLYCPSSVPFVGPHVRAGCVMYPIRLTELDRSGFLEATDCVVFDVDAADVEVTSSREDLQYTSATKDTLVELIARYEAAYIASVQARVDDAADYFMACKAFHDVTSTLGYLRKRTVMPQVRWRGAVLRSNLNWFVENDIAKFDYLTSGWVRFDRFDRKIVSPESVAGSKLVVEHVPFRSMERFEKLGLVGQRIIWARVPKPKMEEFLGHLGMTADEVTILDSARVEVRRNRNPDGTARPKTMRVRRVITGNEDQRIDVDMALGGIYMRKVHARHGRETFNIGDAYRGQYLRDLQEMIGQITQLGLWDEPPQILIPNRDDELNEHWTPLGDYLVELLSENVDLSRIDLTPELRPSNIVSDIRSRVIESGSYRFDFTNGPEDLRQFQIDAIALHEQLLRQQRVEPDANMKTYQLLSKLKHVEVQQRDREQVVNPVDALHRRWNALTQKYPLITVIFHQGWYVNRIQSELMSHYLNLLKLQEELEVQQELAA